MLNGAEAKGVAEAIQTASVPPVESDTVSTTAEGGLRSEAEEIETQAQQSRTPESGENLLKSEPPAS
jgi:hypothetical protein